ncbi:hypothetical protein CDIK_0590 [Cucumispora dikerogammari]|nr:hypothetical protein CDIK_0590 [Cucumispora dikerogammari]
MPWCVFFLINFFFGKNTMIYKYKIILDPSQINIDATAVIKNLVKINCGQLVYEKVRIKCISDLIYINYLVNNDHVFYTVQATLFSIESLHGSYCKIVDMY